jgi:hypothetical protein
VAEPSNILLLRPCRCLQVRPEFPAPQPGQLPLPRSLPPQLQQQLTAELPGWQQLPWPAGQVPQQPRPNPKAALQFKVGTSVFAWYVAFACAPWP